MTSPSCERKRGLFQNQNWAPQPLKVCLLLPSSVGHGHSDRVCSRGAGTAVWPRVGSDSFTALMGESLIPAFTHLSHSAAWPLLCGRNRSRCVRCVCGQKRQRPCPGKDELPVAVGTNNEQNESPVWELRWRRMPSGTVAH